MSTKGDYRVTRALKFHHLSPLSRTCVDDITGESGTSINILCTHWGRASVSFSPPVSTRNHEKEKSAWCFTGGRQWMSSEMRVPFGQHKSPEIECRLEVIIFQLIDTGISFIGLGLVQGSNFLVDLTPESAVET